MNINIDVMTIVWLMVALFIFSLVVLVFYLVALVAEAKKTIKITNSIALKVDKEIAPILKSTKEISKAAEDVSVDLERKYQKATALVSGLEMAVDIVNKNKVGILQKLIPSQKSFDSTVAGIKRGIDVFFASKKEDAEQTQEKRGDEDA